MTMWVPSVPRNSCTDPRRQDEENVRSLPATPLLAGPEAPLPLPTHPRRLPISLRRPPRCFRDAYHRNLQAGSLVNNPHSTLAGPAA